MVKQFISQQFGIVRVVIQNNEPWFVAADVCRALELSDTNMSLKRLDDDEKGTSSVCTPGGCIYRIKLASCTENFRQVAGENLPPRRKGPPVMGSASRSGWQSVGSVIVVGNRDAILGQNSLQQLSAFQVKV